MLIRIIPLVIAFACHTDSPQKIQSSTRTAARMNVQVTPLTAEMEVEYLPPVKVVAVQEEVQIEYIPSAE